MVDGIAIINLNLIVLVREDEELRFDFARPDFGRDGKLSRVVTISFGLVQETFQIATLHADSTETGCLMFGRNPDTK